MNLAWLLPLGFAALAAWLVPLLLHLRRRSEQHRTAFAALAWLPARARPRRRLRFEEWPLLLVRLLLLAALALLLAHPVLFGAPQAARWVVVAPGAEPALSEPREDSTEYRRLAPGFPGLDQAAAAEPAAARVPVASLLRELDASLPADVELTVVVPARLDGADAVRPVLHRRVQWRVVGSEARRSLPEPVRPSAPARPPLVVRHDGRDGAVRFLRAVAIAWQADVPGKTRRGTPDIATRDAPLPPTDRPLGWAASGPLPDALLAWVDRGGSVLADAAAVVPGMARDGIPLWRDERGDVLVRGLGRGRGRLLQWTRPLSAEAMPIVLEPSFPERVWQLFAPAPPPAAVAARDYAPLAGAPAWPAVPRDLQPWLLVLVAGLFAIERWLATGRRQARDA